MNGMKEWYVRMSNGNVYGPADVASLVSWAEDGRIDPSSSLSKDRIKWTPAQLMDDRQRLLLCAEGPPARGVEG